MAEKEQPRSGHPRFYELLQEIGDLHHRKNKDYSGGRPLGNLQECDFLSIPSWKGVLVRMTDKWARIKNLVALKTEPEVSDESLLDTLKDLAVYSLICIILLEEDTNSGISVKAEEKQNSVAYSTLQQIQTLQDQVKTQAERLRGFMQVNQEIVEVLDHISKQESIPSPLRDTAKSAVALLASSYTADSTPPEILDEEETLRCQATIRRLTESTQVLLLTCGFQVFLCRLKDHHQFAIPDRSEEIWVDATMRGDGLAEIRYVRDSKMHILTDVPYLRLDSSDPSDQTLLEGFQMLELAD